MRSFKPMLRETVSLFVDDARFASAIVAWLAVAGIVLPRMAASPTFRCSIFFGGLALILMESSLRHARTR